jgi:Ca2+-binding EF-hand superfamily protein
MKKIILHTFTGLLFTAFSFTALADHRQQLLLQMDQDGDGLVSQQEFRTPARAPRHDLIGHIDADGDDAVSSDELNQHFAERAGEARRHQEEMQARLQQHFESADSDGDGLLTREEARAATFNRLDDDGDGYLNHEELRMARRHNAPRAKPHRLFRNGS